MASDRLLPTDGTDEAGSTDPPDVLLITGPAGAGKTSAADAWARSRPYRCAHASLDDVRWMVKSGYADPRQGWGPEPRRQLDLARGSTAMLARRFVAAGIRCVIDDAIFREWPEADYPPWSRELHGLTHRLVVLLPTLDVALRRNSERRGSRLLSPEMTGMIHDMMIAWRDDEVALVIDNSALSVDQTVRSIEAALSGQQLPLPE